MDDFKIVRVLWRDSSISGDSMSLDELPDVCIVTSVGYLVREDTLLGGVTLAAELYENPQPGASGDWIARNIVTIPHECIQSIEEL